MANDLTLFKDMPALDADVAAFFDEESNIKPKATVPSLGYEGKVWSISLNGEKTKLMKKNEEGDEMPLGIMRVVVLGYNQRRGRAYYEGSYDPAKPGLPLCYSDDGIKVAPRIIKQVEDSGDKPFNGWIGKCEGCPMSVKGSKVTDAGKASTACSQHRMLVVVPANKLDFEPLRLKLAMTSDYDGQSPEQEAQGWYAFSNFMDFIRSRGVKHSAQIVMKMKFDPGVAYPKVLFSPDRPLNNDEVRAIMPVVASDKVKQLLDGTWSADGVNGTKELPAGRPMTDALDKAVERETKAAAPAADPEAEAKAAAAKATAEKKAKKKAEAEAAAKAAAEAAERARKAAEDDDDGEIVLPGTAAAAASEAAKPVQQSKPATTKPAGDLPNDVSALINEWND